VVEMEIEVDEEGLVVDKTLPAAGALSGILVTLIAAILRRSD